MRIKYIFFITAKITYKIRCHCNFIYKDKMNKRNNQILTDAVPIGKNLLKVGVREPKVANIDDTLFSLNSTFSK